jgi:MSHA biogenesis protein MshL
LLFQQRNRQITKSEVVILLKPTIVHSDRNWQQDLSETRERIRALQPGSNQQQKSSTPQ